MNQLRRFTWCASRTRRLIGFADKKRRCSPLGVRDILVWVDELKGPRPVGLLSDGYRSTVALFADLARRCAILNPHLLEKAAEKTPGIVLIDEVDLHLHPSWQRRLIADLRKAFPAIQFVLTTHSPQVISGATHSYSTFMARRRGHLRVKQWRKTHCQGYLQPGPKRPMWLLCDEFDS